MNAIQHWVSDWMHTHGRVMRVVNWVIHTIEHMPLPQGIIIMMVLGISLGSFAFKNVELAAYVTRMLSLGMVFVLGTLTLFLLRTAPTNQKYMLGGGILLLMGATVLQLIEVQTELFQMAHDLSVMTIMLFLFLVVVHNNKEKNKDE